MDQAGPEETKRRVPEHLRVPWGIGDVVVMLVAWFGLQAVIALVLRAVAMASPAVAALLAGVSNGSNIAALFALNLVNAALGLGIVGLVLRRHGATWSQLGWRKVNLIRSLLYLVGVIVVFVMISNVLLLLLQALVPGFKANQPQTNEFITAAGAHRNLALVALVVLPPILEETIFRGFLFPALAKRWGTVMGAILSSALFGLAHLQLNISVYTFLLGLLLCFMYVRLRSIVPGIALHMLNNYLAFLALRQ